jgi:hypothetical protein
MPAMLHEPAPPEQAPSVIATERAIPILGATRHFCLEQEERSSEDRQNHERSIAEIADEPRPIERRQEQVPPVSRQNPSRTLTE